MKMLKTLGILLAGMLLAATAQAEPAFLVTLGQTYPQYSGPLMARGCANCHASDSDLTMNPYGAALKSEMQAEGAEKLTAAILHKLESADSDKDGASNLDEIKAGTAPGDPKSTPAAKPAPTAPAPGAGKPAPGSQPAAKPSPGAVSPAPNSPPIGTGTANPVTPATPGSAPAPQPATPTAPAAAPLKPWFTVDALDFSLAEQYYNISGNRSKFEQYGTPPQGLIIPRLWMFGGHPGDGYLAMDLVQPGREDQRLMFQLFTPLNNGQVRIDDNTWREHPELTFLATSRLYRALAINQPVWKGVALQAHLNEWSLIPSDSSVPFVNRPTLPYANFSLKSGDVGAVVPVGSAKVSVGYTGTDFTDRTGDQPGNTTSEGRAAVRGALNSRVSGEASYSYTSTSVNTRALPVESTVGHNNTEGIASFDVQATPRDNLAVRGYFRNTSSTRNFNLSGYASDINTGGTRIAWRAVPGMMVQMGYEYRAIDYITAQHAATDHPKVQTAFATASYRPVRRVELTARYSSERRFGLPESPRPSLGIFESPVTPSDITNLEFGAGYTPSDRGGVNYEFTQQRSVNPERSLAFRIQQQALVGWAQPLSRLTLTASYDEFLYSSGFLSPYLSNAHVITAGASVTVTQRWFIDSSVTYNESDGASSVTDHGVDASAHYQVGPSTEGILDVTTGRFEDLLSNDNNMEYTGVNLRLRKHF
ncbi:MAG TPA: hypothetical protein VFJ58_17525 [Armatimonadota bacterium]|nr:hypothetical protein [Armatimonadota bacterium]